MLGFAGSMASGYGLGAGVAKAASVIPEAMRGAAFLKGAVDMASFAASDDITKAMLGKQNGDPSLPVSAALLHIGAAGLMGAATSGVFNLGEGVIGKGLENLQSDKMKTKVVDYLAKLGEKGDPLGELGISHEINAGLTKTAAGTIATKTGTGLMGYETIQAALKPMVEKITGRPIAAANSVVTDAVIKSILTNEVSGLPNAVHYAVQVGKGVQHVNHAMDYLFKAGTAALSGPAAEYAQKKLKDFIEQGQVGQQMQNQTQAPSVPGFAKGGVVEAQVSPTPDSFSKIFPEQNILLHAAKGRISNYLNGLRPLENPAKLAFDENPPDKEKQRTYDKAIGFAVNPLKILDHVNKGDLTPDDMKHFVALYPEAHSYLSQQMIKRITKAQLKEEKPPYKKRQAMSLFLGTSLDGSLTPPAIMAAQGTFAQKQAQQQPPTKPKKGTATLSKASQSYQTDSQAREGRMQKQ